MQAHDPRKGVALAPRPVAWESLAVDNGADHIGLGVNAGRHQAYASVMARGYRVGLVGVSMHRANDEGYSRPGTWLVDDWR